MSSNKSNVWSFFEKYLLQRKPNVLPVLQYRNAKEIRHRRLENIVNLRKIKNKATEWNPLLKNNLKTSHMINFINIQKETLPDVSVKCVAYNGFSIRPISQLSSINGYIKGQYKIVDKKNFIYEYERVFGCPSCNL